MERAGCYRVFTETASGAPFGPATIRVALAELQNRDLVAGAGEGSQQRWTALPAVGDPLLDAVDLHGAHGFRHTFATWLEDAGIPARVIDEVMGHEATSRVSQQRGSAMGAHYRHTTPEMAARISMAIEQRLRLLLVVVEQALEAHPAAQHAERRRTNEGQKGKPAEPAGRVMADDPAVPAEAERTGSS